MWASDSTLDLFRRHRFRGQRRQTGWADRHRQLGQQPGEARLDPDVARESASLRLECRRDIAGHPLKGAILQQPRKEQIACLQQCEVLGILHLAGRYEAGGFKSSSVAATTTKWLV